MLTFIRDNEPIEKVISHGNQARQYDFMMHCFVLWQYQKSPPVSLGFVRDLNFYAAHLVSPTPGVFRHQTQHNVRITNTDHVPPSWEYVEAHLGNFITEIHRGYTESDPIDHAAYVLWPLNWIHPFAQGNGRTARALCYFLLCQRFNTWLKGSPNLLELIKRNNDEYYSLLGNLDKHVDPDGRTDVQPMARFLLRLLEEQTAAAEESEPD